MNNESELKPSLTENSLIIGGGDGSTCCLVADLGLFHNKICEGKSITLLECIRKELQPKMNCPLKIIPPEEMVGIRMDFTAVPSGFIISQDENHVPEIGYP